MAYDLKTLNDGSGYVFVGYTTTPSGDKNAYIAKANQYGYIEWNESLGSTKDDEFKEILLRDNTIFVIGTVTDSTNDVNLTKGKDMMYASFDYNGNLLGDSLKIFKRSNDQEGNSIGIIDGDIILAGSSTGQNAGTFGTNEEESKDFFLMKIDSKTGFTTVKQEGGAGDDEINSIIVINGKIYATGITNYTGFDPNNNLNLGGLNVAKVVFSSELTSPTDFTSDGGEFNDVGNKMMRSAGNQYVIIGNKKIDGSDKLFLSRIDFNQADASITTRSIDKDFNVTFSTNGNDVGNDVFQTSDGGYIIVGSTDGEGNGGKDVLLLKVDASGSEVWHKTYGGAGDEIGYSVEETEDNGYIVLATTKLGVGDDLTDQEIMLLKVNSVGELK